MVPLQVDEDEQFRGDPWAFVLSLPTDHDWSQSVFTVSNNLPDPTMMTVTTVLTGSAPQVTLMMDGSVTATLAQDTIKWYLKETPVLNRTFMVSSINLTS